MGASEKEGTSVAVAPSRLDGWKEIANHLSRSTRTVQRWEREEGLPVRRLSAQSRRVYAFPHEIDAWMRHNPVVLAQPEELEPEPIVGFRKRFAFLAGVLLALAIVAAAALTKPGPQTRTRIAVLPLDDLSEGAAQGQLAERLTWEITSDSRARGASDSVSSPSIPSPPSGALVPR